MTDPIMPTSIMSALRALEVAMLAETEALLARDIRGVAGLSEAKVAATVAFTEARQRMTPVEKRNPALPGARERLSRLVAANRTALEGALAVQKRVVEVIARAATRADAAALPGYSRTARRDTAAHAVLVQA